MEDVELDPERTRAAGQAGDALRAGRGVLITGETGSGRSHFLRSVVAGLDQETRRRLWLYDDDRPLDERAVKRLLEAASAGEGVPVVVTPPRGTLEPWQRTLAWEHDHLWVRLAPFDPTAMLTIARRFLDGPIDPKSVPVLVPRRAGGDLVVLREALREIRTSGGLSRSDGVWSLSGPIPPLDGTRALIRQRSGSGDEPAGDLIETALDVIALAPELGLDRTRRLLGELTSDLPGAAAAREAVFEPGTDDVLERLESNGVIDAIERHGTVRCRVHDPVVELLLPHTIGRLRRRRISNAIVGALSDRPAAESEDGELLALARLALPLGWPVDAAALTRAAATALRSSRLDLACRLATAALADGAPMEAEFVLAAAQSQLGRSDEALARLEAIRFEEADDPNRIRTHEELVRLVAARVDDPSTQWSLPSPRPVAAGTGEDSVDLTALSATSEGQHSASGLLESGAMIDQAVVLHGERVAFEASLAVMQGKSDLAVRMLSDAEEILRSAGADTFRVRWGQIYSKLWDQPFDLTLEQLSLLGDEAASLGQAEQEVLCRWSAGLTLGHSGRVAEAIPELEAALSGLQRAGLAEAALLAQIALAHALAEGGEAQRAGEMIELVVTSTAGKPLIEGWALDGRGAVLLGSGRRADAAHAFRAAAELHGVSGLSLSQIIALSGAARAGAADEVLETIDALAANVDGCCIALLVRQARALARRQIGSEPGDGSLAAEFDAAGDQASALSMHRHAAECYAAAAELHRTGGRQREAANSSRRAAEQTAFGGTIGGGGPDVQAPSGLSEREQEIAGLAADGLTNRQIADRLVLSIRTVETHLLRAFRKLGVRRRSELPGALPGAPTPPRSTGMPMRFEALHDGELNS